MIHLFGTVNHILKPNVFAMGVFGAENRNGTDEIDISGGSAGTANWLSSGSAPKGELRSSAWFRLREEQRNSRNISHFTSLRNTQKAG
jgi:hypothetical protein